MDLRSTLNLPDPDFTIPMKADLPALEPRIQERWAEANLYHHIQEARKDAPTFVLHDGPPYTNSPIHIGTALNKILKDFVVKSRTMMGYRAPYVPGYDNHGLPIEQAVLKEFHERKEKPDVVTLRRACREHARKYIEIQTLQFQRLGVFGLWEAPYATMDFQYEAEIVRVFKRLVRSGFVYRGLRSTLWSPTSQTALADTEIVYQDHVSRAIFVRFPLREDRGGWAEGLDNLHTIIWTTTPWTIPANLAVAFHPSLEYSIVRSGKAHYLVAKTLSERVREAIGAEEWTPVREVLGASLEGSRFKHPIFDRDSVAVLADYVSSEEGTGVVHTAPGHGRDDFLTGVKYGLDILSPVDERGVLTWEAGEFQGVSYKDCDQVVVERLDELGHLLKAYDHAHSYPYSERDGKPVIFRATEQWFVGMDTNDLRNRMLEQIERVQWHPASGESRIGAMIRTRPDWCISRQRPWGVGIPILYGAESGKPVFDTEAIESVARLVEQEGSDAWFAKEPKEFLPPGYKHPETGETEFRKEADVLDVWFDSGCTSLCVLEGNVNPVWKEPWPADLYLEGSDQHRGWFNSSLVIATAVRGEAPYKNVLTHGFVTDEQGRKMSKRLGNVVEPIEACEKYGADVVRLWVASVDWENDVPCGEALLKQVGENYRRIRNTLRFLLSNLYDFDPEVHSAELLDLDEWAVEQTELLAAACVDAYERFDFGYVSTAIHNFCRNELSSFYLDAIKDRMYCDGKEWPSRRAAQTACHRILATLTKLLAPVLSHTCEEVWERIPSAQRDSIHTLTFDRPSKERLESIEASPRQARYASLLEVREGLFAAFENWKAEHEVKDSQDVVASLVVPNGRAKMLGSFGEDLPILFKFSAVEVAEGPEALTFRKSEFLKCERSRLRRANVEVVDGVPLSARDRKVLQI
jgi:isoleucyl-tRNA synthetase